MEEAGESSSMSSDFNHPDEFPDFEEHSIDIVAGYYEGAIAAGLIALIKDEVTIERYQSTEPNTNPNGNGQPALLTVEIGAKEVRLLVTIESGSAMNGAGSTITISDTKVPRATYDHFKSALTANTIKID
jgi:hypothetical protein